jgi:hypothetical protein
MLNRRTNRPNVCLRRGCGVLALVLLVSPIAAAEPARQSPNPVVELSSGERLRLQVWADAAQRDWLSAHEFDIAGHALGEGWVEVITDAAGAAQLATAGFRFDTLEVRSGPQPLAGMNCMEPNNVNCYADPAEVEAFLDGVVADHPAITRKVALGTSLQGRTIWGLLVSDNAALDEDELAVLFSGAHHAREVMTPEVVMDTIDQLTDLYGSDPDITGWVDDYAIWCVPIVNPDGVEIVHTIDDFWRKNARDNDSSGTLNNQDGVDLNRNYEWGWGNQCAGSSSTWSSQTYRGVSEGSEPEIQAMAALGNRIRPVFDIEYHSYGEDVFYAMSCDPQFNPKLTTIAGPNRDISRVIAEAYAAVIVQADGGVGYGAAPFGSRVDGTGRDHQFHENGAIAFVTEVNTSAEGGFHPDFDTYRDVTVQGQRPGWQFLLDRISGPAIGGLVLDAVTGQPVAADVSLDEMLLPDGKRLTSRGDTGRFHVIVVDGSYTLRVSAPGYQDFGTNVAVAGTWVPTDVNLVPNGSSLVVSDDLEDPATPTTWTAGDASDTATFGLWTWGVPEGTHVGTVILGDLEFGNARFDRTPGEGKHAFVTGNAPGGNIGIDDVDGGVTTLTSPSYDLSGLYGVEIAWQRWFRNDPIDPGDNLVTEVSVDGGPWLGLETLTASTSTPDATPAWTPAAVRLDDVAAPTADVRLRVRANDGVIDNTVEAAIDDLTIRGYGLAAQGQIVNVALSGGATTVLDWDVVTGAPDALYDVARGDLANLGGAGGGVTLGPLTCIEENSIDTSTAGDADSAVPAVGEAFFYVVRFNLGFSTGEWGRGSAGGLRTGTGGCSP